MFFRFNLTLFSLLTVLLLLSSCTSVHLVRCGDQQTVEIQSLAAELKSRQFVCIGEVHSEYKHHENQLEIIKNLHDAGIDLALGLEMFSFTNQGQLDRWNQGALDWTNFARLYSQNWKVPLALYEAIFLYAREKHIPLIGLNLPPPLAHKVARQGFSSLTPPELQNLPDHVSCRQDSVQMLLLRRMLTAHGGDTVRFTNFCEAQTLRDKTIALKAYQYQLDNPQKTVLILAGIGHCLKQGMTEHLDRHSGQRTVVILPGISAQILGKSITTEEADYILQP
jgi:uncharacterized iron-regulated protein